MRDRGKGSGGHQNKINKLANCPFHVSDNCDSYYHFSHGINKGTLLGFSVSSIRELSLKEMTNASDDKLQVLTDVRRRKVGEKEAKLWHLS